MYLKDFFLFSVFVHTSKVEQSLSCARVNSSSSCKCKRTRLKKRVASVKNLLCYCLGYLGSKKRWNIIVSRLKHNALKKLTHGTFRDVYPLFCNFISILIVYTIANNISILECIALSIDLLQ